MKQRRHRATKYRKHEEKGRVDQLGFEPAPAVVAGFVSLGEQQHRCIDGPHPLGAFENRMVKLRQKTLAVQRHYYSRALANGVCGETQFLIERATAYASHRIEGTLGR